MMNASHAALAEANRRYAIIQPVLEERALVDTTTPARTIRYWAARYRVAAQTLGGVYVVLLPKLHQGGNRRPRLPQPVMTALGVFGEHVYDRRQHNRNN